MLLTPEQIVHLGCIITLCAFLLGIAFLIACDKDADDAEEKEKQEKEKQRHYDELKEWRLGFQKELDNRDEDASHKWLLREQRHYHTGLRDRGDVQRLSRPTSSNTTTTRRSDDTDDYDATAAILASTAATNVAVDSSMSYSSSPSFSDTPTSVDCSSPSSFDSGGGCDCSGGGMDCSF